MSLASSRAVIGRFIGVAGGEAKDGAVEEGVGGIYDGSGLVIIDRGSRSGCRKWKKPTAPQPRKRSAGAQTMARDVAMSTIGRWNALHRLDNSY
jgi:hypothetical protein